MIFQILCVCKTLQQIIIESFEDSCLLKPLLLQEQLQSSCSPSISSLEIRVSAGDVPSLNTLHKTEFPLLYKLALLGRVLFAEIILQKQRVDSC
jgi:hypothetical protein